MPASVYLNSTFVFAERSKGKVTLRTGNLEVTLATKMRKQLLHWERSPVFCEGVCCLPRAGAEQLKDIYLHLDSLFSGLLLEGKLHFLVIGPLLQAVFAYI